jgi:putative heme transporter
VIRGRFRRGGGGDEPGEETTFEVDPASLTGVFSTPRWLRDLGITSWLLLGVAALVVALIYLLSLVHTIAIPLIVATIVAAVLSPTIARMQRRGIPRGLSAGIILLAVVVVGALLLFLILRGIASESSEISSKLSQGADKVTNAVQDVGVDETAATGAEQEAKSSISSASHTLLNGVAKGLKTLSSLAVFLSFTVIALFFMLKDGPQLRGWMDRHVGLPVDVARTISGRTLASLRAYFAGVTIVSAFTTVIVGLAAVILGVPLAGTIALVTFVGGYIPYLGAWTAGAFAVLIALGDQGVGTAVALGVIVLLANGILQQMVQPVAFGATLEIHPLAVLAVTIGGGCLFGTIGLILAAPLTSAAVKIAADLERATKQQAEAAGASAQEAPATS